jgi:hypothetical protein
MKIDLQRMKEIFLLISKQASYIGLIFDGTSDDKMKKRIVIII